MHRLVEASCWACLKNLKPSHICGEKYSNRICTQFKGIFLKAMGAIFLLTELVFYTCSVKEHDFSFLRNGLANALLKIHFDWIYNSKELRLVLYLTFLVSLLLFLQLLCSGHADCDIMTGLGWSKTMLSLKGAVTSVSCLYPLCQPKYSHDYTE